MSPPPKPASRPDGAGILTRLRLFRSDIFASQPERLYHARMAEMRTPLKRSVLINAPELIREVLIARPDDFPKPGFLQAALAELLGRSIFVTNDAEWQRARRIIDPAFAGGRLRSTFPAMRAAGDAAIARLQQAGPKVEIEAATAHLAADIIFRTLFSRSIETEIAAEIFDHFQRYQRSAPLLSPLDLAGLPHWLPRPGRRDARSAARAIRARIAELVAMRVGDIDAGRAPDDLATRIMTTPDPETGTCFSPTEMTDQVAIFLLAGHETSASALSWALYLLATHAEFQNRAADEALAIDDEIELADIRSLGLIRNVIRETLRLYPPVPMMLRETRQPERFRERRQPPGTLVILSPWHLQRHQRLWNDPDNFDPDRWDRAPCPPHEDSYLPFSAGSRVCPGAGFAMLEATLLLAQILRAFRLAPVPGRTPAPIAQLTVRAREGIWLQLTRR